MILFHKQKTLKRIYKSFNSYLRDNRMSLYQLIIQKRSQDSLILKKHIDRINFILFQITIQLLLIEPTKDWLMIIDRSIK